MFVYISNTNVLRLRGLTKESDGSLITGAAVSVSVASAAGVPLAGMVWPQAMADVGSGNYELALLFSLSWLLDTEYVATIDAVSAAGVGHWEHHFKTRRRTTS